MSTLIRSLCLVLSLAAATAPSVAQNLNDVLRGEVKREAGSSNLKAGHSALLGGGSGMRALEKAELRDLARSATVYVLNLVQTDGGLKLASSGSGFFIDPATVLTNSHVVDKADAVMIAVAGRGYVPAAIVSDTHVMQNGRQDFAILRLDQAVDGVAALAIGAPVDSLEAVFAAGYPGVVIERDQKNKDLQQGDLSAVPELVISAGAVQNILQNDSGVEMVTHSAMINHGNSGGPLLNACGQVVGINTEISLDKARIQIGGQAVADEKGNPAVAYVHGGFGFAQSVQEIRAFLGSRNQQFSQASGCRE